MNASVRTRAVLLLVLLGMLLPACSAPLYVARQAWGQLKVLNGREKIRRVLLRPDLSPERRRKLELVLTVRRYAFEEIGLKRTAAYTRFFDTGGEPLAHNLSACPKDSLRPKVWRFPIVGGLPYIGFFEKAKGLVRQKALDAAGWDTYYRPVSAFSSLGWFADPVYSSMLATSDGRLADIILHETTHTTIFLRNRIAFNESLAVFIGNQGAMNFLARLHGPKSKQVTEFKNKIVMRRRFSLLIKRLYARLEKLYSSDLSKQEKVKRRQEHFHWAQAEYKRIFPDPRRWGSFVRQPLNNAVVLSYGRYNTGLRFHRAVYRALGRNLNRFVALYRRAQQFDDPIAYVAGRTGLAWMVKQKM